MADNINVTPGSGATVSTKEVTTLNGVGVSAQQVQRTIASLSTGGAAAVDISSTNPLPVIQIGGYTSAVSLTRTADTNVYAANDIIGAATGSTAAIEFTNVGSSGANIFVSGVELMIESSGLIGGETSYRLHLYSVTPPSALGDNAAFDLPSGDRSAYLGYVDITTPVDLGSTLYASVDNLNKMVKLSGTSLFGYLTTIGGYTPTSARVYKTTLHTVVI